jgi:hypothetical protein
MKDEEQVKSAKKYKRSRHRRAPQRSKNISPGLRRRGGTSALFFINRAPKSHKSNTAHTAYSAPSRPFRLTRSQEAPESVFMRKV